MSELRTILFGELPTRGVRKAWDAMNVGEERGGFRRRGDVMKNHENFGRSRITIYALLPASIFAGGWATVIRVVRAELAGNTLAFNLLSYQCCPWHSGRRNTNKLLRLWNNDGKQRAVEWQEMGETY